MKQWAKRLVSTKMQISMAYKVPFFVSMFVFIFPLLAKIMLWKAIYGSQPRGTSMGGFDVGDMITYFLVWQLVFEISWCRIDFRIVNDIIQGELSRYLLLPLSYKRFVATDYAGSIFVPRFLSALIIFPLLMLCFRSSIQLHVTWASAGLGLVSLALCCVHYYALLICLGMVAFWIETRPPFTEVMLSFLGGCIVPIDLMPGWLQHLSAVLPFKYGNYFTTKVLMGKMSVDETLFGLAIQAFWIFAMFGIARIVWRRGIKRYQAYGG